MNRWDVQTNALSVYNAISRARTDKTKGELLEFLRSAWDAATGPENIDAAVAYLETLKFVEVRGELVVPTKRKPDGRAPAVQRTVDRKSLIRTEFF